MSRWLGLDHGDRRLGVAISDAAGILATPLRTLAVQGVRDAVAQVAALAGPHGVTGIVVGLPLHMDGREGERAVLARRFLTKLQAALPGMDIRTWDERWTTRSVERMFAETGTRRERRKELVDQLAAQQILQGFLDSLAPFPPPPEPP
jgi:putative Holliday junction resolvase